MKVAVRYQETLGIVYAFERRVPSAFSANRNLSLRTRTPKERELFVKRLAGDAAAVASASPPTFGRAPRGCPAAAPPIVKVLVESLQERGAVLEVILRLSGVLCPGIHFAVHQQDKYHATP